jgi:Putative zinc-finger
MLECRQMDELMMDWLYDELDPTSSARVAEHVGICPRCSAEVGALRRTREAFRDLSDLEPPASVSAILLHEAARRAPAAAHHPSPDVAAAAGFGARLRSWFRFPALHPAATAVATLVLVAGVAGTIYVRRGSDMAAPKRYAVETTAATDSSSSSAASPGSTLEQAPTQPADGLLFKEGRAGSPAEPSPGPAGVRAQVLDDARQNELEEAQAASAFSADTGGLDAARGGSKSGLGNLRVEAKVEADQKQSRRSEGREGFVDPESDRREKNRDKADRGDAPAGKPADSVDVAPAETPLKQVQDDPSANAVTGAGPAAPAPEPSLAAERSRLVDRKAAGATGRASNAAPPAAQPPASAPAPTAGADADDAEGAESGRYRPYRDRPLTKEEQGWLESQELKLGELARGKRCREAAAIANDILDRNPDYYTRRVKNSKEVEPCRWYVGDEQKRRAMRRAQKPPPPARSGAGASQKAKAAPAKDEAAEQTKK